MFISQAKCWYFSPQHTEHKNIIQKQCKIQTLTIFYLRCEFISFDKLMSLQISCQIHIAMNTEGINLFPCHVLLSLIALFAVILVNCFLSFLAQFRICLTSFGVTEHVRHCFKFACMYCRRIFCVVYKWVWRRI